MRDSLFESPSKIRKPEKRWLHLNHTVHGRRFLGEIIEIIGTRFQKLVQSPPPI